MHVEQQHRYVREMGGGEEQVWDRERGGVGRGTPNTTLKPLRPSRLGQVREWFAISMKTQFIDRRILSLATRWPSQERGHRGNTIGAASAIGQTE